MTTAEVAERAKVTIYACDAAGRSLTHMTDIHDFQGNILCNTASALGEGTDL